MISRRSIITGLASLVASPAIVKATSLMPVRGVIMDAPNLAIDALVRERITNAQRIMSEAVWRNVYTMTIRGTDVNGSTIFEEVSFNGPFVST